MAAFSRKSSFITVKNKSSFTTVKIWLILPLVSHGFESICIDQLYSRILQQLQNCFSLLNAANLSFSVLTLLFYLSSTMIRLLLRFLCAMAHNFLYCNNKFIIINYIIINYITIISNKIYIFIFIFFIFIFIFLYFYNNSLCNRYIP